MDYNRLLEVKGILRDPADDRTPEQIAHAFGLVATDEVRSARDGGPVTPPTLKELGLQALSGNDEVSPYFVPKAGV